MRKQARECAYLLVFASLFSGGEDGGAALARLTEEYKLTEEDAAFTQGRLFGVTENRRALEEAIGRLSEGFPPDRIYKTDLAALLLGAYEILYCPDIPPAVAIDEAVSLGRKYTAPKSAGFINGVLAAVLKEKEGKQP